MFRWLVVLAVCAAIGGVGAVYLRVVQLPEHLDPWAPLDARLTPNWLTSFKLGRAKADPALCMAALATSGLRYVPVPDRTTGNGCAFDNAVRISGGAEVAVSSPFTLSCRAALSFAMWERHTVQPAAQSRLKSDVTQISHLGSYACRNVNTGDGATAASGRRSRHATADALDIAGFTLTDGRRISVLRDWQTSGDSAMSPVSPMSPTALFLRDSHQGACRFFDGVLGPDYNAVHANHFHLEDGGFGLCR